MRHFSALSFLLGFVLVSLACFGTVTEPVEVTMDAPAVGQGGAGTESTAAVVPKGEVIDADHAVNLYFDDCHAVAQVNSEMAEAEIDACEDYPFDQMCAQDPSGCFDKRESCLQGCSAPCQTCNAACGKPCDTCKSKCDGAAGCLLGCAMARDECHQACIGARDTCHQACIKNESQCGKDFNATRDRLCPNCDAMRECQGGNGQKGCREKFATEDKRCWEWCPEWW